MYPRNSSYISRLVRQEHVKEELLSRQGSEQKSPIKKTFYEAKQNMVEYENAEGHRYQTKDYQMEPRLTYLESDESSYVDKGYDSYSQDDKSHLNVRVATHQIRSTESFLNDSSPEYFHPEEYIRAVKKDRTRRRRSKEMIETELVISSNDDEPTRRKPEAMRSISEDMPSNRPVKPVTRRSLSHPEREKEVRVHCN